MENVKHLFRVPTQPIRRKVWLELVGWRVMRIIESFLKYLRKQSLL